MILPPILEDLVVSQLIISIAYGLGLMIFLVIRRKRTGIDLSSDLLDSLAVRIFVWLVVIMSSISLGGIIIDTYAKHHHAIPLLPHHLFK